LDLVKAGKIDFTEAESVLRDTMSEIESLSRWSKLPDVVDIGFWESFIKQTHLDIIAAG